ncbi:MAG: rRNA pseudouridine synthase [Acidiferrobacterales bacterium]|nr:rRNA pseudouridine synthase [Acidiferrobacterales bacterium]
MAQRGLCSRREADRFIEQGLVLVDGEPVTTLGTKVRESQHVALAADAEKTQSEKVTVLINKPMNYVSGLPEDGYESAVMLIQKENRHSAWDPVPGRHGLAPAGRLDIDSMGLIVFTNDGRIARQLIGENTRVEKEYLVWVRGGVTDEKIELLRHGLSLDGKRLKPAKIELLKGSQIKMVLQEGRKRQIRRMCDLVDLKVSRLIRVRIGNVKLGDLESGKWRLLKRGETF